METAALILCSCSRVLVGTQGKRVGTGKVRQRGQDLPCGVLEPGQLAEHSFDDLLLEEGMHDDRRAATVFGAPGIVEVPGHR